MAYGSAFGFSGYDPFMSSVEGFLTGGISNYFGKKSAKKALQYQKALATWQAKNMPSLQKEGLIKAGYNPLLALSGIGGQSLPSAFSGFMPSIPSSSGEGGYDAQEFAAAKESLKQMRATTDMMTSEATALREESSARRAQAYVDEIEAKAAQAALTGQRDIVRFNDQPSIYESPQFDRIVKKLENQIEYDSYQRSKMHAIWEDGINAIHGINQGASAYEHWKSARRPYNSSGRYYRR